MAPEDLLVKESGENGICRAYNRILDRARALPDCEGVVLIHDDVELAAGSRENLLEGLKAPNAGVVGVVGGRGLYGGQWVLARRRFGYANDYYGHRRYGRSAGEVDVVDGLLLAISPAALARCRFDDQQHPAFHGYDTDFCLQVREAGLAVRVIPLSYVHHDKGNVGDRVAFARSSAALKASWPTWIIPLSPASSAFLALKEWCVVNVGRIRHLAFETIKHGPRRRR